MTQRFVAEVDLILVPVYKPMRGVPDVRYHANWRGVALVALVGNILIIIITSGRVCGSDGNPCAVGETVVAAAVCAVHPRFVWRARAVMPPRRTSLNKTQCVAA